MLRFASGEVEVDAVIREPFSARNSLRTGKNRGNFAYFGPKLPAVTAGLTFDADSVKADRITEDSKECA